MASDLKTKGKLAVNRLVIGLLFIIVFGLVGGVATFILGVPLRGDVQDLGLVDFSAQGFGIVIWFVASTLIIAGIAIFFVRRMGLFIPFKSAEKGKPDIPKKTTIVTAIALGAIISLMFFLINSVLNIFDQDLSATQITVLLNSFMEGNIVNIIMGLIFAIIVGTVVVYFASRTSTIEEVVDTAGINKI